MLPIFKMAASSRSRFACVLLKSGRICWPFGAVIEPSARLNVRYLVSGEDLVQKPKRPSGPFMLFSLQKRQHIIADTPNITMPEIAKLVGKMWRELSEEEKESYKTAARENMETYVDEMSDFKASLSPEELQKMQEEKEQLKATKAKRRNRQELRKLEKPKRPLSAYCIFMQSRLTNTTGSLTNKMTDNAAQWKQMSDEDRKVFIESAAKLKQEYKAAMEVWEAKMVKSGKLSVIRKYQKRQIDKDAKRQQEDELDNPPF